jgi:hypothetical protein
MIKKYTDRKQFKCNLEQGLKVLGSRQKTDVDRDGPRAHPSSAQPQFLQAQFRRRDENAENLALNQLLCSSQLCCV